MTDERDVYEASVCRELLGLGLEGLDLGGLDAAALKRLVGVGIVGEDVDAAPDAREDAS